MIRDEIWDDYLDTGGLDHASEDSKTMITPLQGETLELVVEIMTPDSMARAETPGQLVTDDSVGELDVDLDKDENHGELDSVMKKSH